MPVIIKVEGLSKHYGPLKAVDDLSFTVNEGDVYGFLGQNGAGKSTTIRMLLTLVQPTSGRMELFGLDLYTHRKEILRQVGAVIERPDLYKYLTAWENLALFARMSGANTSRSRLAEQLEMVGLKDRMHSKVRTFSQGMKQRLGIAVALVHAPKLIILDEPVNGLDPQGIADMRNLILHLSRNMGKTIVVSSHLLNEMELIASRMLIIDRGKKVAEGDMNQLFNPVNMRVAFTVKNPETAIRFLQAGAWKERVTGCRGETITLQMNRQDVPALTTALVHAGADIVAIQPMHSLESYFLSLTSENRHVDSFTN